MPHSYTPAYTHRPPQKTQELLVLAVGKTCNIYDAMSRAAWRNRGEPVAKRIGQLLCTIDELERDGKHKARSVACAELGDLVGTFAIEYLISAANKPHPLYFAP